eukprot:2741990-Pleurochrysis_carterae.AAC.4
MSVRFAGGQRSVPSATASCSPSLPPRAARASVHACQPPPAPPHPRACGGVDRVHPRALHLRRRGHRVRQGRTGEVVDVNLQETGVQVLLPSAQPACRLQRPVPPRPRACRRVNAEPRASSRVPVLGP